VRGVAACACAAFAFASFLVVVPGSNADPGEEDPRTSAAGSDYAAGRKAVEAKDWKSAVVRLNKALLQDDRNPDIQNLLGYAYRNASLPQLSGLALSLGVVIGGNIVTEIAFNYPGLGNLIFKAISNQDFFLLQGIFIFIVLGVLIANFVIDLVFISVDPRTRLSMQGAAA